MSNRFQEYNADLRQEQLERNRAHNVQVMREKAAILAASGRRSLGVKARRS